MGTQRDVVDDVRQLERRTIVSTNQVPIVRRATAGAAQLERQIPIVLRRRIHPIPNAAGTHFPAADVVRNRIPKADDREEKWM